MKTLAKNEGYQKFIGRGSLDQRLRAVVAYKRENLASADGKSYVGCSALVLITLHQPAYPPSYRLSFQ